MFPMNFSSVTTIEKRSFWQTAESKCDDSFFGNYHRPLAYARDHEAFKRRSIDTKPSYVQETKPSISAQH
jgi:hypothetical protein